MGAQMGKLAWAHLPGTLRYGWKGLWRWSRSLSLSFCGGSVKGRDGSLAGDPEGYVEKVLEMGISFHTGPIWGTWRRACLPGWKWLWGWSISLWRSSFTEDPGIYVKKVSRYGHLSLCGLLSIWGEPGMGGGAHIPGTLIDEWRRALVGGHLSMRDSIKGTLREGSFTGELKRWYFWEIQNAP